MQCLFRNGNFIRSHFIENVYPTLDFYYFKVARQQRYSAKVKYHGQEICYPGNRFCQDVVPPATWSRTRVRKLSGAFVNVFGKVWIDSLRHYRSDACPSDLVANSVETKGLSLSSFYEMLLFRIDLERIVNPYVLPWPGRWLICISAYHGTVSLFKAFPAAKQVSSNPWILASFC